MLKKVKQDLLHKHDGLSQLLSRHIPESAALLQSLDQADEVALYLLNPDYPQRTLTAEEQRAVLEYPAYWAFCWASGQVLAAWLLANREQVAGKRVMDFGCGSGVAGIAAALAGAASVVACDIDPDALTATAANADVNGVNLKRVDCFEDCGSDFDMVLAADVLYDRANLPWLEKFFAAAPEVLLADSRIRDFTHPHYERIGTMDSNTVPDLDESPEFRRVSLYRGRRPCLAQ